MIRRKFVFYVMFSLLASLLLSREAFALVSGKAIADDKYGNAIGAVALVEADNSDNPENTFKCVGVFIRSDLVLTAGHCLRGPKKNFRVRIATNAQSTEYETLSVKDFRWHPLTNAGDDGEMYQNFKFNENAGSYHDIGVIRLDVPSNYAVPMPLVPSDLDVTKVEKPNMFLFGRLRDDLFRDKGTIGFAQVSNPRAVANSSFYVARHEPWPDGDLVSSCVGDSGGPVTLTGEDEFVPGRNIHYLVGIYTMHSDRVIPGPDRLVEAKKIWGGIDKIPDCGLDVGYVDVQAERSWIEKAMAQLDPDERPKLVVFGEQQTSSSAKATPAANAMDTEYADDDDADTVMANAALQAGKLNELAPPPSRDRTFIRYPKYDLTGATYDKSRRDTEKSCQSACAADGQCRAYTFDAWNRVCYLKSDPGMANLNARGRSGVLKDTPEAPRSTARITFELFNNKAFSGSGYRTTKMQSRDLCRVICEGEGQCMAFNYKVATNNCTLFKEVGEYSSRQGMQSGSKIQE